VKKFLFIIFVLIGNLHLFAQEDYTQSTITRTNAYSLSFFSSLRENADIVVSPFGLSNCMAMVYIGSEGTTKETIANRMNFITPMGVLVSFKQLIKRYQVYKSNEINLLAGNALWIAQSKDVQKKYKNLLKVNFGAHVQEIEVQNDNENGLKSINRWIKKASNFNILNLLRNEDIDPSDELIYTNYIFFDGSWENPFNQQLTGKDDFRLTDGQKKKIDFMNQTSYLKYNENEVFQILELPYSGRNISMIVLLPKEGFSLDTIQKMLNPVNYDFWTSELYTKLVSLSFPKFRIENSYSISQFQNDKGLENMYSDQADFSRISKDPIKPSKIIQKSIIQVVENKNSNFTELVGNLDFSNRSKDKTFVRFKADHPFIFIIKDNLNNSILLIGQVLSPNFNNLSADYSN
jgi:serpin B